ncbi:hypothetical protein BJY04DRAFT_213195 [Aspergillus karnatakaensis]|uniref:Zn(II)2Cys6 transcription factor domain-containing protein n=1 Tax=Aspergillus karnatakaensis TaxID=1810916 RepID=UPI003CCDAFAF
MDPGQCSAFSRPPSEHREGVKPGRLRAACTACHSAKVRCSGEKTGCTRCKTLGHECVYLESRVGKTRGRRKRHLLSPGAAAQCMTAISALENRPATANAENGPSGESSTRQEQSPASSLDEGDEDLEADFLNNELWDLSNPIADAAMLDTDLSGMQFLQQFSNENTTWEDAEEHRIEPRKQRLDSAIGLSSDDGTAPSSTARQSPWKVDDHIVKPSRHTGTTFPTRFSQPSNSTSRYPPCSGLIQPNTKSAVLLAAEILEHLEEKISAGLSAIDEVLRINKEATQKINQLLKRADYTRSMGSLMVVVAAAHHVVSLFEVACEDLYASPCHDNHHALYRNRGGTLNRGLKLKIQGALHPPGIGFGSFLLDPQDQIALGARIICTELHRTLKMVQALSSPMQTGCFAPELAPMAVDGWLQDLNGRLRTLISGLESSEQSWS